MPKILATVKKRPELFIGLLLLGACIFVYQTSGMLTLASTDNVPHTLLAFNWLENHTLNLDNFRDSYLLSRGDADPHYFSEAPNGHLTSTYPIGTALVSFPLYLFFFIYLKVTALFQSLGGQSSNLLDLTNPDFDQTRRFFGRLAGTICSAVSVLLLYLGLRLKFNRTIALLATFTYAFATNTWVLGSQDLRQHTVSNLLLAALMLCLLKTNRVTGRHRKTLLLTAGIFCGLLPSVRLTSAIFAAAAIAYAVYVYRKECLYLLVGLLSIVPNWIWNSYYFGLENFSRGGYLRQFEAGASSYDLTINYIISAFLGQLISPSDGLFVFSPVLLFALLGCYMAYRQFRQVEQRDSHDELLLLGLALACLGLFLHYCIYKPWDGGSGSYGPRFLMDVLPVACFLIGYALHFLTASPAFPQRLTQLLLPLFLLTLLWSTAIQTLGAFTDTNWGKVPLPLLSQPQRRWSLADSQIERHFHNFLVRAAPPIRDPQAYGQELAGQLERLELVKRNGQSDPIGPQLNLRVGARRILQATVKNTGESTWFGYQTALEDRGETRLNFRLFDQTGKQMKLQQPDLFISGSPQPGESAAAIGQILFPKKPGTYRLEIALIMAGFEQDFASKPLHELTLVLKPRER